ncbi:hypothetical protein SAMN05519105_2039 [Rhodobacter sp. 24-YEA-8]|nr:hypothetical protein SAMN05519105_2039 [Rhodobacter sp. 24-YEA-8]
MSTGGSNDDNVLSGWLLQSMTFMTAWRSVSSGLVFGLFVQFIRPLALMVSANQVPVLAIGLYVSWTKPGGS